jgi:hypothetical protein
MRHSLVLFAVLLALPASAGTISLSVRCRRGFSRLRGVDGLRCRVSAALGAAASFPSGTTRPRVYFRGEAKT